MLANKHGSVYPAQLGQPWVHPPAGGSSRGSSRGSTAGGARNADKFDVRHRPTPNNLDGSQTIGTGEARKHTPLSVELADAVAKLNHGRILHGTLFESPRPAKTRISISLTHPAYHLKSEQLPQSATQCCETSDIILEVNKKHFEPVYHSKITSNTSLPC